MVSLAALILSLVIKDEALRQLFAFACVLGAYYFALRGITREVTPQVKRRSTVISGSKN